MRLTLALIAFLPALAAASPAAALERLIDISNDRWVEVSGEGSVSAAPDFAQATLGVTTTGKTAGEAMAANAKAANALVSLIKAEGVAPADIQTSELSISPMFSQPAPGQTSAPTITGYNVSNNVAVIIRDIPRLGALLDKAHRWGGRQFNLRHRLWPQQSERAARQSAPAGGHRRAPRRKAEICTPTQGSQRSAGSWCSRGRGRPPTAHGLFPRIRL